MARIQTSQSGAWASGESAGSALWRPMDRALVGVSGLRMRCALPNLTPVAEMPQNPRAETAGWLAQLCLLGLGLVGVAKPNRSWGAASPTPSHAGQRISLTKVTRAPASDRNGAAAVRVLSGCWRRDFRRPPRPRGVNSREREPGSVRATRRLQMPLTQWQGRPTRCRRSCERRGGRR